MKQLLVWIGKAVVSGVLAFAILTAFCLLYYNVPVHASTADGATDYAWEKNKFYSRATEGFAWGETNNEGYANLYDYREGMDVDILFLGSSHMEAFNVAMEKSVAARLSDMGAGTVYNLGTSAHSFLTCADNLESALEKYSPRQYVVIETATVVFAKENLEKAIAGDVEEMSSHTGGIVGVLQKNPFLRLLYSQLSHWADNAGAEEKTNKPKIDPAGEDVQLYTELLRQMQKTASDHGVKLLIFYHPALAIDPETGMANVKTAAAAEQFASCCREAGVGFIDMTDRFLEAYETEHILPHGFANTSVGEGHLNAHGHRMIAEEVYKFIGEDA